MTCTLRGGHRMWEGETDAEGHRTYNIEWIVESDVTDGPYNVMRCPGLPIPGVIWHFKNDIDQWAYCLATKKAISLGQKEGEPVYLWKVPQVFSTRPPQRQRCQDNPIEDPLLEPPDISVGYNRYTEEATHNLYGFPLTNSAWEPLRGPQVEFDKNRGVIKIKQNVPSYFQGVLLPSRFVDCVNISTLWGIPARCVKLSAAPTERKFYGHCSVYWARTLEFDVDMDTFDRDVLDEGTKVLHGRWNTSGEWELIDIDGSTPDPFNPQHFDQFKDKNGENSRVVLNGRGLPAGVVTIRTPSAQQYYVRVASSGVAGIAPTNTTVWVLQAGGDSFWDATALYVRGNVVVLQSTGDYYIALTENFDDEPPSAVWAVLSNGINDKGDYDNTTAYTLGDRVLYPAPTVTEAESAGSIFVQKYEGVNFLLLGIPTVLGV